MATATGHGINTSRIKCRHNVSDTKINIMPSALDRHGHLALICAEITTFSWFFHHCVAKISLISCNIFTLLSGTLKGRPQSQPIHLLEGRKGSEEPFVAPGTDANAASGSPHQFQVLARRAGQVNGQGPAIQESKLPNVGHRAQRARSPRLQRNPPFHQEIGPGAFSMADESVIPS